MRVTVMIGVFNLVQVYANNDTEGRVVNGKLTRIQKHPHSVYMFLFESRNSHVCGASIVNQRVILTAAHCFEYTTKSGTITANVGSSHTDRGSVFLINSVKVHPKYDPIRIINDIALAGLENPIAFGLNVKRIVVANKMPKQGTALLAGWGVVQETPNYEFSQYLHEVSVPFMSRPKCQRLRMKIDEGTFCGGRLRAKSHPAVGDSGSPLVLDGFIQIGLVSYKNNVFSKSMIIYTDVPYFYKWIVKNAKSVYCERQFNIPNYNNSYKAVEEDT